ncbi:MAG: hypothetical protein ACXVFN_20900 [Solirubrobacteraceae bacterium]
MSLLRDFLVAPRTEEAVDGGAPRAGEGAVDDRGPRRSRRVPLATSSVAAPAIGVLAPARELPVAAAGVGLAIAASAPAVLVCLPAPVSVPAFRVPPRGAAARLAASLRARGLEASARGRLALVQLSDEGRTEVVTRALAAAGPLPTVLAVAGRDDEVDALLAARDAILVALPSSAEPALAHLALAGATALVPAAAAVTLTLDPVQRALALAGVCPPRTISTAVRQLVA